MICTTCGYDNLPGEDQCAQCGTDLLDQDIPVPKEGIQRNIMEDTLGVLCTHPPTTVTADTPLREILRLMKTKKIGSVVIGTREPFEGIFTERDFLFKVAGKNMDLDKTKVGELMTRRVATLSTDKPIAAALYQMSVQGIRHLPLVKDGKLVEILSVHDILNYLHRVTATAAKS
jgi:CBS domain-containing protein